LTSALDGGEWSASLPCRFTPGNDIPVPIEWEAGWVPEPVWTMWRTGRSSPLPGIELQPSSPRPVAIRTRIINGRRVRLAALLARVVDRRNAKRILVENLLGRPKHRFERNNKIDLIIRE
jgi:hypothetical protein